MSGSFSYTLQTVNGDPSADGGKIIITSGIVYDAVFNESNVVTLSDVASGDTVTIRGFVYSYEYLGSHDVRGDPSQPAAYIRISSAPNDGTFSVGDTFAMDLSGVPGDPDYPNLQNGNTKATVADLDTTTEVKFPGVICFAAGTTLLTPNGEVAVEDLCKGDLVETADSGAQPVLWIGSTKMVFDGNNEKHKPIFVASHALGKDKPRRDLILSPHHKILLESIDGDGILAPAKGLTKQRRIRRMRGRREVEYFHVLLSSHSIIFSHGLATESFYPGQTAMKMLTAKQRLEIEAALPWFKNDPGAYGPRARQSLTRRQAEELPIDQCGFGFDDIPVVLKSA